MHLMVLLSSNGAERFKDDVYTSEVASLMGTPMWLTVIVSELCRAAVYGVGLCLFFFFTEFAVKEFGQSRQQADTTFWQKKYELQLKGNVLNSVTRKSSWNVMKFRVLVTTRTRFLSTTSRNARLGSVQRWNELWKGRHAAWINFQRNTALSCTR